MGNTSVMIALASLVVAVIVAIYNISKDGRNKEKTNTSEITTVIVKLESINNGVSEIKSEMKNVKRDIQELRDRIIVVEQSSNSAHHRIDSVEEHYK